MATANEKESFDLILTPIQWKKLAADAQWFAANVTEQIEAQP